MSTSTAVDLVKQHLRDRVEHCCQRLQQLAESLPATLIELEAAEQLVRQGVLEVGRELLQSWSEVADAKAITPQCEACQEPMRHKGYVEGPLVTTLGSVRVRRARFRCEYCHQECYPHDERLRFRGHAVSWPLAKVIGRLGAQLPFEQARQSLQAVPNCEHSSPMVRGGCGRWRDCTSPTPSRFSTGRELGLRVGSGQVEGACKSLVAARCKQSGMRNWTQRGAEGVLRLRAALQTGRYDALWTTPAHAAA